MKTNIKNICVTILAFILVFTMCLSAYGEDAEEILIQNTEGYDDAVVTGDKIVDQTVSTEEKSDEANPDANKEYAGGESIVNDSKYSRIVFSNPVESQNMEFEDGLGRIDVTQNHVLYSELAQFDNIPARKFYKGNDLCIRLNNTFFKAEDREFVFVIKYWDFGDGAGSIYVDYPVASGTSPKRLSIRKPGTMARWRTEVLILSLKHMTKKNISRPR